MYNLIFFVCLSCGNKETEKIAIRWTNERATAIVIPTSYFKDISEPAEQAIVIRLMNQQVAILGSYRSEANTIVFEPLVPFTRGLRYELIVNGKQRGEFIIPERNADERPVLTNIYPTQDTLPENLLKVYFEFSQPMMEGVSAQHIALLLNHQDTLHDVFLDLQPELWNTERTRLTLWLDPGRIKRDLIPNKLLGNPLQKGHAYTLEVDDDWKDIHGTSLAQPYRKKFVTVVRDSISPDPKQWTLEVPEVNSVHSLKINFNAPLDFSLLMSALHVVTENHEQILGKWETGVEEKSIQFIPNLEWKKGKYLLQIETRLEDLAGNNINHPFEQTIQNNQQTVSNEAMVNIPFVVK